jgi:hypothetical protein
MKNLTSKDAFDDDKNKILLGFILILLACLLFTIKIILIGNERDQMKQNAASTATFATWND